MPEEINRIIADHISDYLFVPTEEAKNNLLREGIHPKKIFFAGNTIADAIKQNIKIASKKEEILEKFNLEKSKYLLLTLHRPSNVDNKLRLAFLLEEIEKVSKEFNYPIIWPIHPRAKKMLSEFDLRVSERIILTEPLGYFEFLQLQKNAILILSDSGGIQEEACILGVPCITLRENTERPETISCGSNRLMSNNLCQDCKNVLEKKTDWKNPYGEGNSGKIIIECLKHTYLI